MSSTAAGNTGSTETRARLCLRHLLSAMVIALALVALEATSLDATVSGWFYDPASGAFPLRYNAVLETVSHQWAKQLVIFIAGCAIALFLLSFVLPELGPLRRPLLFLALAMTLAPLAVALLKAASARHCPWSLLQYGGFAPHLGLFDAAPAGFEAGKCFPAGHASTGFCLMAFHFFGRALRLPRLERWGLHGGMIAGFALGLGRVAQGAHFLSHVLWAGVVCWTVIVILHAVVRPERLAAAHDSGAA
jgi:membrane-associated PAP2 superfamily phosphatase